jgi:hypothetical protein
MRITALAIAVFAVMPASAPSFAQRDAVSSALSPEAAASAFGDAVINACVPAIVSPQGMKGLPQGVRAKLSPTNDVATRAQAGATADEVVWDVLGARGVVTVHERAGRCAVSVYGPPAMPTIMSLSQQLAGAGFERLVTTAPPGGVLQTLVKTAGGRRVTVQLGASEPGSPGHQSRFTVVTATVFAAQ